MSRARHKKAAKGGVQHEYNAVGSPTMSEAKSKNESFKTGGKAKKAGGKVESGKSKMRMDKKPRRAAGGSVFSNASKKSAAAKDAAGQGHEGDGPKGEDPDRGKYKAGGRLTGAERKALPKSDFVFKSERKYPIEDKSHARNALARVSQFGNSSEKAKVRAAVHRKYPEIGQSKD
jgi:hypothetical protein